MSLLDIGDDSSLEIFQYCDLKSKIALSACCKRYADSPMREAVWRQMSLKFWSAIVPFEQEHFEVAMDTIAQVTWKTILQNLLNPDKDGPSYEVKRAGKHPKSVLMTEFVKRKPIKSNTALEIFHDGSFKYGNWISNGTGNGWFHFKTKKYTGQFVDKEYHGNGTIQFDNGIKYTGNFQEGNIQGQGTMTWPDGFSYTGKWTENEPEESENCVHTKIKECNTRGECSRTVTSEILAPQRMRFHREGLLCEGCLNNCQHDLTGLIGGFTWEKEKVCACTNPVCIPKHLRN
jgi:hypothetical protein